MSWYILKRGFLSLVPVMGLCLLIISPAYSTTYYVRLDGGTATQCTGLADAPYPGTGTNRDCAFSHPFWAIAPQGNNPTKMAGGDTLIIDGSNGAQYMIGYGAPNTSDTAKCYSAWPWDCYMRRIPSGPDAAHPTRILGKSWDTGCANPPQLWGNERVSRVLNLVGSNNIDIQCLEVTDHSACQEFGPAACNRNSPPFGKWGHAGIEAADSSTVYIKNVNIHGMAHTGIHAGRLKDWAIEDSQIVANSFVGWDGDVGAFNSSNSGTLIFNRTKIEYSGCGETYSDKKPYNCYSQDQGGYGDGFGTHQTGGNWIFNNVDFSHNVSDGLDLLYHNGNGTITIKRSRFEGNAGNQVKTAANTTIENSLIIGNCAYFHNSPITWNSTTFNDCRALGSSVAFSFRSGMTADILNSTLTSNGDTIILTTGGSCNGTEKLTLRNNIYLGGANYHRQPDLTGLYYAAGTTGNGDGPCGTLKPDDDYSVIYRTKTISSDCSGKPHSKCQDPKLVEPLVSYYTGNAYNVNLQSTSPAIGNGLVLTGKSSLDYNNNERGTVWDIGAVEYGIAPTQPTCKDGIQYCLTQTDCTSNGHYWYNNTCNAQPKQLTCADGIQYCLTQTDCVSNGHYWYNNTCNTQPQPKTCADGIQYCTTQTTCEGQNYFWYNNTCNAQPQLAPTCADGAQYCKNKPQCTNQGYYWYSNACNAQPQLVPTCADGIQYCSTKSECEGRGYHWYANSCNLEPKVQPTPQPQQEQKQDEPLSSGPTTSTPGSDSPQTLPTTTESISDSGSTEDISPETRDAKAAPVDSSSPQPKSLASSSSGESKSAGTESSGKGGRGGGGGGGGGGKSSGGSSGGGTSSIGAGSGSGVPTNIFGAPSPVKSTGLPGQLPSNLIKGAPQATPSQSAKRAAPTTAPQSTKGVAPTTASQPATANKTDSALITPSLQLTDTTSISLNRDDIPAQTEVAAEPPVEPDENVNLPKTEDETSFNKTIVWINDLWAKMLRWLSGD